MEILRFYVLEPLALFWTKSWNISKKNLWKSCELSSTFSCDSFTKILRINFQYKNKYFMVTKNYPLIWRLTIILSIIHILSWNIALISWFWITLILIIVISKKFTFGIGNGISSKNILSWKRFLAKIVILKSKYEVSL